MVNPLTTWAVTCQVVRPRERLGPARASPSPWHPSLEDSTVGVVLARGRGQQGMRPTAGCLGTSFEEKGSRCQVSGEPHCPVPHIFGVQQTVSGTPLDLHSPLDGKGDWPASSRWDTLDPSDLS